MAVSQNGWPGLASNSPLLLRWEVPNTDHTELVLRNGSAGFLLVHFAAYFDKNVDDLDFNYMGGRLDDWAYAYRAVRGYVVLSNHGSGTAMDLNATEHPLGKEGTFERAEVDMINRRLNIYEDCIRWGGDYNGRKDEMHFEINRSLGACENVARRLMHETKVGKQIIRNHPVQKRVIYS